MSLKLRALNEIHRTKKPGVSPKRQNGLIVEPGQRPVIEVIRPGAVFLADDQEQFDQFTSGRYPAAIRESKAEVTGTVTKSQGSMPGASDTQSASAAQIASEEGGDGGAQATDVSGGDLDSMTKDELVALAEEEGVKIDKRKSKADIAEQITSARQEKAEGTGSSETPAEKAGDDEDLL